MSAIQSLYARATAQPIFGSLAMGQVRSTDGKFTSTATSSRSICSRRALPERSSADSMVSVCPFSAAAAMIRCHAGETLPSLDTGPPLSATPRPVMRGWESESMMKERLPSSSVSMSTGLLSRKAGSQYFSDQVTSDSSTWLPQS